MAPIDIKNKNTLYLLILVVDVFSFVIQVM